VTSLAINHLDQYFVSCHRQVIVLVSERGLFEGCRLGVARASTLINCWTSSTYLNYKNNLYILIRIYIHQVFIEGI